MSTSATGTAARPMSPQTQKACWKPPVSASAAAWPCPSSPWERVAATVEAMAIPIAPPSC